MAKWTLPVLCLVGMVVLLLPEFFSQSVMNGGIQPPGPPRMDWRLSMMDPNGDGSVTLAEAQSVRPEITAEDFKMRDTNGDGVWNAQDRRGSYRTMAGRRSMEEVDKNSDGKVTLEEYVTACQEEFKTLDVDSDGGIIEGEWPRRFFPGPPPMAGLGPWGPPLEGPQAGPPPGPPPGDEMENQPPAGFPPGVKAAEENPSTQ